MTEQEQITKSFADLTSYRRGMKNRKIANDIFILLAALKAAEKERDALAAYAVKLEKAGDKIRNYKPDSNQLQAETDIEELFDDWDAARKEKPGA